MRGGNDYEKAYAVGIVNGLSLAVNDGGFKVKDNLDAKHRERS